MTKKQQKYFDCWNIKQIYSVNSSPNLRIVDKNLILLIILSMTTVTTGLRLCFFISGFSASRFRMKAHESDDSNNIDHIGYITAIKIEF
jgi:hypothetical protein